MRTASLRRARSPARCRHFHLRRRFSFDRFAGFVPLSPNHSFASVAASRPAANSGTIRRMPTDLPICKPTARNFGSSHTWLLRACSASFACAIARWCDIMQAMPQATANSKKERDQNERSGQRTITLCQPDEGREDQKHQRRQRGQRGDDGEDDDRRADAGLRFDRQLQMTDQAAEHLLVARLECGSVLSPPSYRRQVIAAKSRRTRIRCRRPAPAWCRAAA